MKAGKPKPQGAAGRQSEFAIGGFEAIESEPNPCVRLFGPGPEGARCKSCESLFHNGRYLKYRLRTITNGPGTDHRAGWKACAKYQPAKANTEAE